MKRACLAFVCAALACGVAGAAEVKIERSKIVQVVVYVDRAEITRQATVQLPAGASSIVLPGLPPSVDADSLRISGKGVPAALGAVELKREAQERKATPEWLAADAEVRRLEGEQNKLGLEEKADQQMAEFLASLAKGTGARSGDRLAEGKPDLEAVKGFFGFVRGQVDDLGKRAERRVERRRELQEQLDVARAKRDAAQPRGPVESLAAIAEVEARQAGALDLEVTYLVPSAAWRPSYRATLDADKGEVVWSAEAVVRQQTGEDWSGVPLRLSTAAPARGVAPPQLPPILVRPTPPRPKLALRTETMRSVMKGAPADEAAGGAMEAPAPALEAVPMEAPEAEVLHTAYNAAFDAPGKSDVPADGRDHRIALRTDALPARLLYRVAPAASETAFVVAKTASPAQYPLLPGVVRVFAGAAFVGQYGVAESAPGAEMDAPFGADNRVIVKRVATPRRGSQEGFISQDQQFDYGFRTTIENRRDRDITIVVEDQLPRSQDERIVVKVGDKTTPGMRDAKDRPGIVEWELTLGPKQRKEIVLEYSVRFPRDLSVDGLPR